MKYQNCYNRNIGSFTEEEQLKLKNSKIFILGAGGIGGLQAATLARMGVGELFILDPGVFDEPDFNRQYAAKRSNLGKNKAMATVAELKEAAPFLKVTAFETKLSEKDLREVVNECNIVIDAIDLQDYDYKVLLAKLAREFKLYNITAPIPHFGAVLMVFAPDGMHFEDFTKNRNYPKISFALRKYQEPEIKSSEEGMAFLGSKSSIACAAALSSALVATEVSLILTGKRDRKNIIAVPFVTYVDLLERHFEVFNPLTLEAN